MQVVGGGRVAVLLLLLALLLCIGLSAGEGAEDQRHVSSTPRHSSSGEHSAHMDDTEAIEGKGEDMDDGDQEEVMAKAQDLARKLAERQEEQRADEQPRKDPLAAIEALTAAVEIQENASASVAAAAKEKVRAERDSTITAPRVEQRERAFVPFSGEMMAKQRARVEDMFWHGYNNYMEHAFPRDELMPITCQGRDTLGSYALTLVDSLDALLVLGNEEEFKKQAEWVMENLDFRGIEENVSVFETNIRILGGLLSAHLMAEERFEDYPWGHGRSLLTIAHEMGDILLVAFDTPTGIPYGTVNLANGGSVPKGESKVTSVAGAGSYILEFGILSRLVGNPAYEDAARAATRAIYERRSSLDLVGNHIDIHSGQWTATAASIAGNIDSFYEYLLKGALLFGDEEMAHMFKVTYSAVMEHLFKHPWYVSADMKTGRVISAQFEALEGFWPGLQVLAGDSFLAADTMHAFHSLWQFLGFVPEAYDLQNDKVARPQYPLRPEMAESLYYLYQATGDSVWLQYGKEMVDSLQLRARAECGFAAVEHVVTGRLRDHMDSFFLSETCKYLYLLFSPEHEIPSSDRYVFTTEGHPFPMRYQWLAGGADHKVFGSCLEPSLLQRITGDNFQPRLHHMRKAEDIARFAAAQATSTPRPASNPTLRTDEERAAANVVSEQQLQQELQQLEEPQAYQQQQHEEAREEEAALPPPLPVHVVLDLDSMDYILDHDMGIIEPMARLIIREPADLVEYDEHILSLATYGPQEFDTMASWAVVARPEDACDLPLNYKDFKDRIVLVRRGKCDFVVKVRNCQAAGALAVVVIDNLETAELISMVGDGDDITIPSMMLEKYYGDQMMEFAKQRNGRVTEVAEGAGNGLFIELTQEGIEYATVFLDQEGLHIYELETFLDEGGEEDVLFALEAAMTANGYLLDEETVAQVREIFYAVRAAEEQRRKVALGDADDDDDGLDLLSEIFGDLAAFGATTDEFGVNKALAFGSEQPLVVGKEAVNCVNGKCHAAFGALP